MAQNKKNNAVGILGIALLVIGFFFLISADSLFGGYDWAYWVAGICLLGFAGLIIYNMVKPKRNV